MQIFTDTPDLYISHLPEDRIAPMEALREVIKSNLPPGFEETMSYGMIGYVVPHTLYPAGYHCDPKLPLPFMNIASQKNFVAVYHMGIYTLPELMDWFVTEYPKHAKGKLDMGKSCIRFKKPDQIPFQLIGELASKMTVEDWVRVYESGLKR
ncbi:MAG TPA: DUF1801 domain-containing protein [Saprospiraceae bacterium]|nr:DUF1801 domain-containing protein [Saprospiraceae bacterium]HRJ14846.1 DUF1801 domain-containing protein [Saprospiraceae bacterium]HRK81873.1 DUF1801 domain-containing protein [Saprospiraceae bacterium]